MGVLPRTLQPGLAAVAPSQDTQPPTAVIAEPSSGGTVTAGASVTVSGTATDVGGQVAGVEVSTNGGSSWRPASGRSSWRYTFTAPSTIGSTITIMSRAVDDSVNIGASSSQVTLTTVARVCDAATPCSIFGVEPGGQDSGDPAAVELGVKFRATSVGQVGAVRFYKPDDQAQTYRGRVYSASGEVLAEASATINGRGWHEISLPSTVAIEPDTTYVSSVFMPGGHYAYDEFGLASARENPPLVALGDGTEGGNGVYRYGSTGGWPTSTYRSSNYWIDVAFVTVSDTTAPAVLSQTPVPDAQGVSRAASITVTLSESLAPSSVTTASFELVDSAGSPVQATVKSAGATATLTPSTFLAPGSRYVARIRGGAGGVTDRSGNPLPEDFTWAFTTSSEDLFPYSMFGTAPGGADSMDAAPVEVGVKFRASQPGSVSTIRFFKPDETAQTYTARLYARDGTLLGEGSNIVAGVGWHDVPLQTGTEILPDTTYVASVYMPNGHYALTEPGLASAVQSPPLTALASGVDGGNGVFTYGVGGGFPASSFNASNYWIDVTLVSGPIAPDTTPPSISTRLPAAGAESVSPSANVRINFSEAIAEASVTPASVIVSGPTGEVPGVRTVSTSTVLFTPSTSLEYGTGYTVTVKGGSQGVTDLAGNGLSGDDTWAFTVRQAPQPRTDPNIGPGGPVLVVPGSGGSGSYLTEILRAEGLNLFQVADTSAISAAGLAPYRAVVLGRTDLSGDQVAALEAWVDGGGNLIAMRPDAGLAALLGLAVAPGSLSEGYLEVDTSVAPGSGIVSETMQFHGTADLYTALSGTQVVARLFRDASTPTANPAVTLRSVGTSGGSAAAFTYDLPESVVLTRQGNPAWAGIDRDGLAPFRSNDLFFPDYVDFSKIEIPQADEQQRLLVNVLTESVRDALPLPRFWYLPRGEQAAIVMTQDEHNSGDVPARFDLELAESPTGCSLDDWECPRSTVYLYSSYPFMTAAQAQQYEGEGFEVALHSYTACANYTRQEFASALSDQLALLATKYPSVEPSTTNRNHCIALSGYTGVPEVLAEQGIHLDTNYYYWPSSWIQDRPGLFTGSGFAQRFAASDGTLVDAYQATTQMTDESGQSFPATAVTLMDNALTKGYYGTFVANLHTDGGEGAAASHLAVIAAAKQRSVPVITAKQLLTWTDGRNSSSYGDVAWDGTSGRMTFSLHVGVGARGLRAMVPMDSGTGRLIGLSGPNGAIAISPKTIKGVQYAFFAAVEGSWTATYEVVQPSVSPSAASPEADQTATTSAAPNSAPGDSGAAVAAATEEPAPQLVDTHDPSITLPMVVGTEEFVGEALPDGWSRTDGTSAQAAAVSGGSLTVNGGGVRGPIGVRRSVEASFAFAGPAEQQFGLVNATDGVSIDLGFTASSGTVRVVRDGRVLLTLPELPEGPHTYRLEVGTDRVTWLIDAVVVHVDQGAPPAELAPLVVDAVEDGSVLSLSDLRFQAYEASGEYTSQAFALNGGSWGSVSWLADLPTDTSLEVLVRVGSTAIPDQDWDPWETVTAGPLPSRWSDRPFLQYRLRLGSTNPLVTPRVQSVRIE